MIFPGAISSEAERSGSNGRLGQTIDPGLRPDPPTASRAEKRHQAARSGASSVGSVVEPENQIRLDGSSSPQTPFGSLSLSSLGVLTCRFPHLCVFPEIPTRLVIRSQDCAGADSKGHRLSADFT